MRRIKSPGSATPFWLTVQDTISPGWLGFDPARVRASPASTAAPELRTSVHTTNHAHALRWDSEQRCVAPLPRAILSWRHHCQAFSPRCCPRRRPPVRDFSGRCMKYELPSSLPRRSIVYFTPAPSTWSFSPPLGDFPPSACRYVFSQATGHGKLAHCVLPHLLGLLLAASARAGSPSRACDQGRPRSAEAPALAPLTPNRSNEGTGRVARDGCSSRPESSLICRIRRPDDCLLSGFPYYKYCECWFFARGYEVPPSHT